MKKEIEQEVRLVVGVRKEVAKLKSTFRTLQAVLNDAEQRQMDDESVKIWLDRFKDAAREMEDVLDEWGTEILRSELEKPEVAGNQQVSKLSSYFCSPFSCVKQVALRHDIASRIKQIRETLDTIKKDIDQFSFIRSDQPRAREGPYTHERKETSSIIIDRPSIFGRESDLQIIVNQLVGVESSINHSENETRDLRFISIIGMGGLGKTTLAQLVFDQVKTKFNLAMWVCVSAPFDRTKVAKAIIREATGRDTNTSIWNALLKELCDSVKGKNFLLVLDDVCTNDPDNLSYLIHLLDCGDQGSRCLVTTRYESVASAFNSYKHILQVLNSEQSCSLLFRKAFHGKEKEKTELLEDIGTQISNKCVGLPLALSLLGSLLNTKINENHWRHVLESKIWELRGFDRHKKLVNPAFLLSYDGLESPLRNCFQYCAIFRKAHKIHKRSLISHWMAQGFLNSSNEAKDPELTGEEYFDELAERSFFQDFSMDGAGRVCCKMHDLVHDFAQYLAEGHCSESYNNEDKFKSPIHLSLIYNDEHEVGLNWFHNSIKKIDNVRTVQCKKKDFNHPFSVGNLSSALIHHLRYLRVLKLKNMGITQLPDEM
ncbi:hypothetical protein MKW94_011351 [Papaver nudicaule]|uniref:Uncharacterized protein n=1 Tax=Papaver nudicaule TaxID=74823 RepID=A0AA41VWQ0_PAPNU|nr:hypothetical protein [Papaver nudicaule]